MSITKRVLNLGSSTPSFESFDVSLEEEVIAAGEAQDELNNAEAESGEIERLQDVADQTAQTVDYIESQVNTDGREGGATENEVALAEQVANLATVGTGESADTVMPSSESYVGATVSCEGLKETIRGIIRAVINAIKKLWARLKKFWRSTTSRLSSLKKSAQDLKARANKASGSAKEKKVKLSGSIAGLLACEGSVAKEFSKMNAGLKDLDKYIGEANEAQNIIATAGEDIADIIADIEPEKASAEEAEFVKKFAGRVDKISSAYTGLTASSDKRFTDKEIALESSKVLLGEKRIFARVRKVTGAGANARSISSLRIWLDSSSDKVKDQSDFEMSTLSTSNISDLAEQVITLVDRMGYYAEGKGLDKVEKASSKVEKALEKLERQGASDDVKGEDGAAIRRIIGLGHAFNDWARNPGASLVNHACTVARAVLTVGTKSLAQY